MDSKIEKYFQNSQFYRNYNNIDFAILQFKKIKNEFNSSKNKYQNKSISILDKIKTEINKFEKINKNNIDFNSDSYNIILTEKINIKHNIKKYVKYINDINKIFIKSVKIGNIRNIDILIEKGANIHTVDDYALRYSSHYEHIEVVKFLINSDLEYYCNKELAKNMVIKHNLTEFYEKFSIK